jgi:hypothetical protein
MTETFIAKVVGENRISIPQLVIDTMKIEKGQKVRVTIEKVR